MAKRGRPPKAKVDELQIEDSYSEDVKISETIEEVVKKQEPSSIGEGTQEDYNPFAENVVERDYATPKVADGVIDEIEEPTFVPPTYEDLISERQTENHQEEPSVFDNPNPALNDLDAKDKAVATESLVDSVLDAYEQAHRLGQYVVRVDEETLMQKQAEGKLDLSTKIPISENGETISIGEFIENFNEQGSEAIKYDNDFGDKVKPAMMRVFMKKGWGMTDEQFLLYHFGRDIATKVGIVYQMKKTINTTLTMLEKNHKINMQQKKSEPIIEKKVRAEVMKDDEKIEAEEIREEIYVERSNIDMPNAPIDKMKEHPKEVQEILKKK
tara:strand:- start:7259 stop:8239 length:981 start_codon:yes stop_codon:yes gene_type:complete